MKERTLVVMMVFAMGGCERVVSDGNPAPTLDALPAPPDAAPTLPDAAPMPDAAPSPFVVQLYDGVRRPEAEGWLVDYTVVPIPGCLAVCCRDPANPLPADNQWRGAILFSDFNADSRSPTISMTHTLAERSTLELSLGWAWDDARADGPHVVVPDSSPQGSHWEAGVAVRIGVLTLIIAGDGWGWSDESAWVPVSDVSTITGVTIDIDAHGQARATINGQSITHSGDPVGGGTITFGDISSATGTGIELTLENVTQSEPPGGVQL